MRKTLSSLWFALLMAMLCVPAVIQANVSVTFRYLSGNTEIQGGTVDVYQNGVRIAQATVGGNYDYETGQYIYNSTATASLNDEMVGKTLAYISAMGHRGEFVVADGVVVDLACSKLSITAKDEGGNPVAGNTISVSGITNTSAYTDEKGQAILYVVPGEYQWSWNYGSGVVDLTTDQTLELTAKKVEELEKYSVRVVGRYGNFPVNNGRYYIYKDGRQVSYIYASGYSTLTSVNGGIYQIRDEIGGTSGDIEIKSDTTIYLDYRKVTFTVKNGDTPVIDQTVKVQLSQNNNDYNFQSKTVNTNAKGVAEFYLLASDYTYTFAGVKFELSVANEDIAKNLETVSVKFNIHCDDINAVVYRINDSEVSPSSDGVINYGCLPDSKLTLTVYNRTDYGWSSDGSSSITVTADANKTVDVNLYSLLFTSNYSGASTIAVYKAESGNNTYGSWYATWNRKYYLLEGNYYYNNPANGERVDINLTENKTIDFNYVTLTVNVKDTEGKLVTDGRVYCDNSSEQPDASGVAKFYVLPGTHSVSWSATGSYYNNMSTEVSVTGDMETTLTIPAMITFTIVGPAGNYYYIYTKEHESVASSLRGGEQTARIDPNKEYVIEGYHGTTRITDGCTITLGTISVTAEGMGLAFPMENWDATSSYGVIVGTTVRLSAVPVGNASFTNWTVNGKEFTEPMVDFKTTEMNTVAKAVFGGNAPSKVQAIQSNSSLDFNDSYVILPNEMEGVARIFTLDGKQVKKVGVAGDKIGIYDLPTGAYVLSLQHDGGVINTRFVKK